MTKPIPDRWADDAPPTIHQRIYAASTQWHVHLGVRVSTTIFDESEANRAIARVFAALDVLHAHAPQQLALILRVVHGLTVTRLAAARGQWRRDVRAALLDRDFVLAPDTTPKGLASVIVHELMHARLERAGFQPDDSNRARIERICCTASRNYIGRLPDDAERQALHRLNDRYLTAPDIFWSDTGEAERIVVWRARQPIWRRILYDLGELARRARGLTPSNDR